MQGVTELLQAILVSEEPKVPDYISCSSVTTRIDNLNLRKIFQQDCIFRPPCYGCLPDQQQKSAAGLASAVPRVPVVRIRLARATCLIGGMRAKLERNEALFYRTYNIRCMSRISTQFSSVGARAIYLQPAI